jgi:hypothetical protein
VASRCLFCFLHSGLGDRGERHSRNTLCQRSLKCFWGDAEPFCTLGPGKQIPGLPEDKNQLLLGRPSRDLVQPQALLDICLCGVATGNGVGWGSWCGRGSGGGCRHGLLRFNGNLGCWDWRCGLGSFGHRRLGGRIGFIIRLALIAILLVKYLQLKSAFGWSLSNLVALLCQQLFVYRDLWTWIDDPFQPPPLPEALPEQLALQLP